MNDEKRRAVALSTKLSIAKQILYEIRDALPHTLDSADWSHVVKVTRAFEDELDRIYEGKRKG
jgi:hypothetical protein